MVYKFERLWTCIHDQNLTRNCNRGGYIVLCSNSHWQSVEWVQNRDNMACFWSFDHESCSSILDVSRLKCSLRFWERYYDYIVHFKLDGCPTFTLSTVRSWGECHEIKKRLSSVIIENNNKNIKTNKQTSKQQTTTQRQQQWQNQLIGNMIFKWNYRWTLMLISFLNPDEFLCGWPRSKHQLTNCFSLHFNLHYVYAFADVKMTFRAFCTNHFLFRIWVTACSLRLHEPPFFADKTAGVTPRCTILYIRRCLIASYQASCRERTSPFLLLLLL